jgi:hypothetical protein
MLPFQRVKCPLLLSAFNQHLANSVELEVAVWASIRELLGSNIGYFDGRFSWFSLLLPGEIVPKLGHERFLPDPFQLILPCHTVRCPH